MTLLCGIRTKLFGLEGDFLFFCAENKREILTKAKAKEV